MIIDYRDLKEFCTAVFKDNGIQEQDASISADVLVCADMRGIPSHGVARLGRYINGIREGLMEKKGAGTVVKDSAVSLLVDAQGALGAPVSYNTMNHTIEKAKTSGMAISIVKNSNHYGIAGYYAMKALEHNMIGFSMTNTAALGVPTCGRKVMFGTNPLAFAAPALKERAFVLDMSTTAVTRGKIEVYNRENKTISPGWAVDARGKTAEDPGQLLEDMFHRKGGGLVPLGGDSETSGGHKGYGLAVLVDIMTGMLSASDWGTHISDSANSSARVSHCFGAIRIDLFCEALEFKTNMDSMLKELREAEPAEGSSRVYYAGLKEQEAYERSMREGVTLSDSVVKSLDKLSRECSIPLPVKV